jgi:signal transduction histidine kinase
MTNLGRRPVRIRLAVFSGALTAVILIVFAVVVGRLLTNRVEADFREDLQGRANGIAVLLTAQNDLDLNQLAMANDADIRVVDEAGRVATLEDVALESPSAPDLGSPDVNEIVSVDDSLRVAAQLVAQNNLQGRLFVQYAQSRDGVDATVERIQLFLVGGVLIGIVLAVVAGMTVANRAMQPIADLTSRARTIARTRDTSLRMPEPHSDDEVAELARTLGEMLGELDAAYSETEQTIQRQREFVADASHELRTPLTSILANLELLESDLDDGSEEQRAAARSALRSSKRMSRLVADLLILARADAGRREEPVDCDLSTIACEAVEEVRPVKGEHQLNANVEPGAALCGNPDELHRMIANLLENAVRHTPPGSTIELRLRRQNERWLLEVADDGPGLPAGLEQQVFERFVRGAGPADEQRSDGAGTGLGLAIVRAVALAHGGGVSAGPSELGGASFEVWLPVADPSGAAREKIESTLRPP